MFDTYLYLESLLPMAALLRKFFYQKKNIFFSKKVR
jgi:hypothetical protein